MNAKELIKGREYWYTDGDQKAAVKYLYSSINHSVFSYNGEPLSLSSVGVQNHIKEK